MYTYIQAGEKLAFELENLIKDNVLSTGIFVPSNNGYRYKNYFINQLPNNRWESSIKTQQGYKIIASTYLKISAFTICRLHDLRQLTLINQVLELDEAYRRNHIDGTYFKSIINNSKIQHQRETAEIRYNLVTARADQAKQLLKKHFIGSLASHIPAEICKNTDNMTKYY